MKKKITLRQNRVNISYLTRRDWSFSVMPSRALLKRKLSYPWPWLLVCVAAIICRCVSISILSHLLLLLWNFHCCYSEQSIWVFLFCVYFGKIEIVLFYIQEELLNLLNFLMNCASLFWFGLQLCELNEITHTICLFTFFFNVQTNYDVQSNISSR